MSRVYVFSSIVVGISIAAQYIAFNEAQWIFAHEYDQTSKITPFAIKNQQVPESMIKQSNCRNKAMIWANVLAGLTLGVSYTVFNIFTIRADSKDNQIAFDMLFFFCGVAIVSVLVLEGFSAVVVGIAIQRIRAFINAGDTSDQVKVSQLIKHVFVLGLNILGAVIYMIACILYAASTKNAEVSDSMITMVNYSVVVTNIFSFFN